MKSKSVILFAISIIVPFISFAQSKKISSKPISKVNMTQTEIMDLKLKITVGKETIIVDFVENETTRDFISILPLTLNMNDLGGREKYCGINKDLSKKRDVVTNFEKGDLCYWLGGGLAAFYNNDGHKVNAGVIVIARLGKGIAIFSNPGVVNARFEAVKK